MPLNLDEMPDQVGHDCLVITGLTGNLLLVKCSSNINRASNCTTYHWVVTDAEESHQQFLISFCSSSINMAPCPPSIWT